MSREAILTKIRSALKAGASEPARASAVAARLADPLPRLVPARTAVAQPERVALFKAFLAAQGTDLVAVPDRRHIPDALAAYLLGHALPLRLRKGSDPYLAGLPWHSAPGLVLAQGPARPGDTAGLSRAVAGVAETGTLVLASGPENPVTLAFVPDTHIVVVGTETIVGSYEEACRLVEAELVPAALPRTLNLISGASRTGDIGGRIVMGAHGPRRLAVILVGIV
jgi:L-lactate dehydrogenase complex protein LldG